MACVFSKNAPASNYPWISVVTVSNPKTASRDYFARPFGWGCTTFCQMPLAFCLNSWFKLAANVQASRLEAIASRLEAIAIRFRLFSIRVCPDIWVGFHLCPACPPRTIPLNNTL